MKEEAHPFARGFLSDAVREVRADVRQRYASLAALLDEVNRRAVEAQHTIKIDRNCAAELYGAVLFGRTITSTQAAVLLLEHGLPSQSRAVLRAALETLFCLGAVANQPHRAEEFLASHQADRRKVAKRVGEWKNPALRAAVESQLTEEKLSEVLSTSGKELNLRDLAKLAEIEDWYLSMYLLLSFSAHGSVADLAKHLVRDNLGEVVGLRNEPEVEAQSASWCYAIEIQLHAIRALSKLFSLGEPELDDFESRLILLSGEDEASG
jgi:Family of unknown function (DUF5677)